MIAEVLLRAWVTGQITNNEFALAWQLFVVTRPQVA
jgi:hypothetical protein